MSRRTENLALTTLVASLGAIAVVSALNSRQPQQQRNRYAAKGDCACEYSESQCRYDYAHGRYLGPWYARDPADRRRDMDDPGPGRSCDYAGGSGGYYGGGARGAAVPVAEEGRSVRTGVETAGGRGGFGRTGRTGGFRFTG